MRVTFYTVNIGKYDYMFPAPRDVVFPAGYNVSWVLFSDTRPVFPRGWDWRPLPPEAPGETSTEINRYCKFFPHKIFLDSDVSIYLDANVVLTGDISVLLHQFEHSGAAIGLGYVDKRRTIQEEGQLIKKSRRFDANTVEAVARQIAHYEQLGLPDTHRLMQGRVIFRRHGDPDLAVAMQTWWDEFMAHSRRDQISLPYAIHKHQLKLHAWDWSVETGSPLFDVARHRPPRGARRPGAYLEAMRSTGSVWPKIYRLLSPLYDLRGPMHRMRTRRRCAKDQKAKEKS